MTIRKDIREAVINLPEEDIRGLLRELTKARQSLIDERNAFKNRTRPKEQLSPARRKKLDKILGEQAIFLDSLNKVTLEMKKNLFEKVENDEDLKEADKEAFRSFIFTTENEIPTTAKFLFIEASTRFDGAIKDFTISIEECLKKFPIWNKFLKDVRGVGPAHAGELIAYLYPERAKYISSFWKYCGLGVDTETGRGDRRQKGKKVEYNPRLKRRVYLISDNLLKQNDEYREIYNNRKNRTTNSPRNWTKAHIHNDAMRYMVKKFIKNLWLRWRELEGLELTPAYEESKLGYNGKHSMQG